MKWSDKHPRKKPKHLVKIDGKGYPIECKKCKKPRYFQMTDNGNLECPKCGEILYFD